MKKILLWAIFMLLAIVAASAASTPIHHYPADTNGSDLGTRGYDWQANSTPSEISPHAVVGNGSWQGNDSIQGWYNRTLTNMEDVRGFVYWVRPETVGASDLSQIEFAKDSNDLVSCITALTNVRCRFRVGSTWRAEYQGTGVLSANTWSHIAFTFGEGAGGELWVDGTSVAANVEIFNFSSDWNWGAIGMSPSGVKNSHDVSIDELYLFDSRLNDTIVTEIYNAGLGNYTYYNGSAPVAGALKNFNVSNIVNLTQIQTFNITITNSSYSEQFNITNTTASLNLSNDVYNITITSLDHFDLFIQDFNISSTDDFNFRTGQGKVTINLTKLITQTQMINFTVLNQNVSNSSTNEGGADQATVFVNTGTTQLRIDGFNFTGASHNYTLSSVLSNESFNFNVTDTIFRINASDSFNGTLIGDLNVNISNTTYSFLVSANDTTGNIVLALENMTFDILLTAPSYEIRTFSFSGLSNESNHTFTMKKSNTVNLSVLNELDRQFILNGTVFIELIGETYSINTTNNTFANTTLLFENVPQGDYEIRYRSDGFQQRSKFVVVTNTGSAQTDLYLLDNENSTDVTFTITDQFLNKLENATIKALRFYNLGGGTSTGFIEVAHCRTNFVGQCSINLQSPEVFYKFLIEYDSKTLFTSTPTEIIGTTFNFQVNTEDNVLVSVQKLNDEIWGNITFVNSTTPNYFLATFNAPTGQLAFACLRVTQRKVQSTNIINETCLSASSGSMTVNINESDISTYTATLYVDTISQNSFLNLATLSVNLATAFETVGLQGLFYTFLLLGVIISVGVFSPSAAIIVTIAGLVFMQFTGMSFIMFGATIVLAVSGLILVGYIKS